MKSVIIYCPHLNRDIRGLLNAVPNPRIHTGYPTDRGEDGCLQCHHEIVHHAQMRQDRAIFVMEDDCAFTTHFDLNEWCLTAQWAESHGYDVVVGGSTRTTGERVIEPGKIEVATFTSAHCVIYLASGYECLLKTTQPHDVSIGLNGARCVLLWPFVAVQRAVFSGILRQEVDYTPLYDAHEQRLGHALGLLEPQIAMPVY